MGVVYLAEDKRLDRKVAIKFLPPDYFGDRVAEKRFEREAKAAAAPHADGLGKSQLIVGSAARRSALPRTAPAHELPELT